MYRRLSSIMFPIVTLVLIGGLYWGYQEHQEKNSVLIKAENQYQRAFHDLTFHVEQLHQQLGNTLAVNSTSEAYHRKGLVNVWRLTSQAQNEISQLPLTYLPFNETEEFLSRIANFAYKTAVRDLTSEPLTEDEFKTLQALYENSKQISKDLYAMQRDVMVNSLRWMDVEVAIAANQPEGGNMVADGLRSVDKKISEYPELNWGPSVSNMYQKRSMKMLSGDMVSPEEIRTKAAKFIGADAASFQITENAKGTEYASYSAMLNQSGSDQAIQMDFTERGGQLLYYVKTRQIGEGNVSSEEARASADRFLEEHGFKNMKPVSYDLFSNAGTFTYVGSQNGVLIYPDKLTVKVALDNAEIVGLQASEYVYKNHKRELPSPILSKEEARKAINPNMQVSKEQLALISNEDGNEVLCFEYSGKINGGVYRIYINALTGLEESIEEMKQQGEEGPTM